MKKETYEILDGRFILLPFGYFFGLPIDGAVGLHGGRRVPCSDSKRAGGTERIGQSSAAKRESGKGGKLDCLGYVESDLGVGLWLLIGFCLVVRFVTMG